MTKKNKEVKTIEKDLSSIERAIKNITRDFEIITELRFKNCQHCIYWDYQGLGSGRCACRPEFNDQDKKIKGTGSKKFGKTTSASDICGKWKLIDTLDGRKEQIAWQVGDNEGYDEFWSEALEISEIEGLFIPFAFDKFIEKFREQGCTKLKLVGYKPVEDQEE